MTPIENGQYWLTNILLVDAIARTRGVSRVAAVKRCARRMRDDALDPEVVALAKKILKAPERNIPVMVRRLQEKMVEENVL